MPELIAETQSLCPVCLGRISANKIQINGHVYLEKRCPDHGEYRTLLWRADAEHYLAWGNYAQEAVGALKSITEVDRGCPYDCGLCPDHKANACTMVMEVTQRCNLHCPICFASTGDRPLYEPDLDTIRVMFQTVLENTGTPTIQLSGGEPTVRDDLPQVLDLGRKMGFEHIMVNTNGVRIAKDKEYLARLKNSGATTIYLQFDGTTDDVYRYTRGADLFECKVEALNNCTEAKIGAILVPTLVPGVNDHQLGDIVQFAKQWIPTVRGIHFQPVSYFGRYPTTAPENKDRITIPDVIEGLVEQTGGELETHNFIPRRSQDAHCSFSSLFVLNDGQLVAITRRVAEQMVSGWGGYTHAPWESARSFMKLHWRFNEREEPTPPAKSCNCWGDFTHAIASNGLTITCMPFQDIWNIDLERLKRCCGHLVTPHKLIIPFCAYYLTSANGKRLYADYSATISHR